MSLISYKRGQGSIVLRVKILNSSVATGAGLTGLTFSSTGLIVSTIADNESTATAYTVAGSTIETVTTLGTFAAPTATKCRFKEVDSTNHKGVYEIQIADARYAVSSAKSLLVSISGATNGAETDCVIPLTDMDPYDVVRAGLTALPNAVAGASGGLHINGSNAGTTTYAALTVTGAFTVSDGFLVSRTTSNASAATFTGNGTGSGAVFTSGAGATGDGVQMTAGSTNGSGLKLVKTGSGSDLNATVTPLVLAKTTNITGFNDVAAGAAMTLTAAYDAAKTAMASYTQPTGFLAATFPTTVASTTNITSAAGVALTSAYDAAKTASQAGDIMKVSTGTGANQLDVTSGVIKANLAQILGTALTETAGQIAAAFKQFFNIASPTSTMNVITTVTTATTATNLTTNNDKTGYALSSAGIQAIYDFAVSLITTAASFGKLVVDNLDAKISTRSTLGGTAQTGDAYGLLNSAQAEPSSVPAANASPVAKIGYVFAKMRNKRLTTATSDKLRNDADSADIASSTLADDGTTFSRTKDV